MRLTLHSPAIEMVFVSPTVEEIIGCPMNTLTNDAGGFGAFIPVQITCLYAKQLDLRISVSSMWVQDQNITYQVHIMLLE